MKSYMKKNVPRIQDGISGFNDYEASHEYNQSIEG